KPLTYKANADLFAKLMTDVLGYKKFMVAGGDVGAPISIMLADKHPKLVSGIYVTDVGYPDQNTDFASLTPAEQKFAGYIQEWWMKQGAYNMIQSTKPQSLAFSMTNSPVGLAAWIMSFMTMVNTGEEIEKRFGIDDLLTNITIYWVTESIAS